MSTKVQRKHLRLGVIFIGAFDVSDSGVVLHHRRVDGSLYASVFDSETEMLRQLNEQHFSIRT